MKKIIYLAIITTEKNSELKQVARKWKQKTRSGQQWEAE